MRNRSIRISPGGSFVVAFRHRWWVLLAGQLAEMDVIAVVDASFMQHTVHEMMLRALA